ncbi:GNAT family N-acetyltransferase [Youngiibacter multivorans]|uniref:RimJ/RimL family protein N-acetyltransferase n=1 Tax=Youngiibacter multivorans TaxID=937251 RepID=A0ABS4G8U2_9CLOT|nr:GNAT family N-acetyltransferase [Youngiibacter multivorans]MBP1920988.1 RimJ/RimL family protein N-acetyltransferase [Youngiibacter multivorans]
MIRLRPLKKCDLKPMIDWFENRLEFMQWCAGKFEYPLTIEQLHEYYDRSENDIDAWIMIAMDTEGNPVGHFLMRKADYINNSIHIGFIVIDKNHRGKGYGRELVDSALKYAFEILKVNRVTLGVFENNASAHSCYLSAGFVDENFN